MVKNRDIEVNMQVGDLVKYRRCGTYGVITRAWEGKFNKVVKVLYEVLWADGTTSDVLPRRLEVVCK
tara:strand:+ start:110 stop:310 length:201 start_codon:yes stop_codon:yes gene_type:complete